MMPHKISKNWRKLETDRHGHLRERVDKSNKARSKASGKSTHYKDQVTRGPKKDQSRVKKGK